METLHQLIDALTDLTDSDRLARTPSAQSDLPLLLDAAETAKLLSLSRAKVCGMASQGEIPSIRIGRTLRIPRGPLLVWIDRMTTSGVNEDPLRLPGWAVRSSEL